MKSSTANHTQPVCVQPPRIARRGLLIGAGVAGAAAVTAGGLHRAMVAEPAAAAPAAAEGAGYRLTPHVLRYYETTKA
jgi:hypothetical protein